MSKIISQQKWNSLHYPISLHQLSEEEGGGWLATIPMLGQAAFTADGETAAQAVQELEALRRDLYEDVVASGQSIPLPQDVTEEKKLPSGKWILRTSPQLHAELQEAARKNGLSFNAYCNHALERGHAISSMYQAVQEAVQAVAESVKIAASSASIKASAGTSLVQRPTRALYQDVAPGYSPRSPRGLSQDSYGFNTTFNTRADLSNQGQNPKANETDMGG